MASSNTGPTEINKVEIYNLKQVMTGKCLYVCYNDREKPNVKSFINSIKSKDLSHLIDNNCKNCDICCSAGSNFTFYIYLRSCKLLKSYQVNTFHLFIYLFIYLSYTLFIRL